MTRYPFAWPAGWKRTPHGAVAIPLQKWAGFTLVDGEDVRVLSCFHWYAHRCRAGVYVRTDVCADGKKKSYLLHRIIMAAKPGQIVDHKDRNGLHNQRHNLRFATTSQNVANGASRGGYSEFKGVTLDKRSGNWKAQIGHSGYHRTQIDGFKDELTAACAYDLLAQHFHGDFAKLNVGTLFLSMGQDGVWRHAVQPAI